MNVAALLNSNTPLKSIKYTSYKAFQAENKFPQCKHQVNEQFLKLIFFPKFFSLERQYCHFCKEKWLFYDIYNVLYFHLRKAIIIAYFFPFGSRHFFAQKGNFFLNLICCQAQEFQIQDRFFQLHGEIYSCLYYHPSLYSKQMSCSKQQ